MTMLTERGLWDARMVLECKACQQNIPLEERRAFYIDEEGNPLLADDSIRFTEKCCARGCLRRQPDFAAQKEWLREVCENAGVQIIYYPKYHCEFNFIELTWGYMKASLRRICTFNFADLKEKIDGLLQPGAIVTKDNEKVEILIQPGGIAIDRIRNFARFCYRFMDGYRKGLSGPILDYTLKKCKFFP
jgi:hypothetical protein